MTEKFGRNYRLTITPIDGSDPIIIEMPFTVRFRAQQDIGSEMNQLDIEIYNLSLEHREHIFQDRYVLGYNVDFSAITKANIVLEAGYSTLYEIYSGYMFQASSTRQGTDIVTHIQALGGKVDIAGTQVQATLQNPQTVGSIIQYLAAQFPNLKIGAIGSFSQSINRPVSLNGNCWDLLRQYSNDKCFVYNGKIYVLNDNEVLQNVSVINSDSGIIGTPRRDQGLLMVTTLLEANVTLGQTVSLQSSVEPRYDGLYRVNGVMHEGTISGAINGHCYSVLKLLSPSQFQPFKTVS